MKTQAEKGSGNKSRYAANDISQLHKETMSLQVKKGFEDNRPETITQRRLNDAIGNPATVTQKKGQTNVVQRALAEDLKSSKIKTVIAGETHGKIPKAAEKRNWEKQGINLIYESATIPGKSKKPDPPILRLSYAWKSLYALKNFWEMVSSTPDLSSVEDQNTMILKEYRELIDIMKDEIEDIGFFVDIRIVKADSLLDKILQGLPMDGPQFTALPRLSQQFIAETKLNYMEQLDLVIGSIHGIGSFADVSFDLDSLRIERSREMLKTINAFKPPKTIYKVGEDHVNDMRAKKMKLAAGVAVLNQDEYEREYNDIDTDPSSGGLAVFNSITNDML